MLKKNTSDYITLLDERYPYRLKNIYKPPFVLFYKGDINLLDVSRKSIGVVGSRKNNEYGKSVTEKIVKELVAENIVVISGVANGIDSIAHCTCIESGGSTIGVIANGIDVYYPIENRDLQEKITKVGLILSEYPSFKETIKDNFPKRNRIIAGLSDGILVTQAKLKSGSMITVSRALEMGKEIFCVPDVIYNESGCNNLIKEGAKLVESAQDILNEI